MCERGRALSVFATIYLLCFSCLQDILYDKCIAGTIVISEKNIAISTLFGTMDITVKKPCENGGKETHCTRRKALGPTG